MSYVRKASQIIEEIKSLNCYNEVAEKLASGEGIASIVRYIQKEARELTHLSETKLYHHLLYYINEEGLHSKYRNNTKAQLILANLEKYLDPLDMYQLLMHVQFERTMWVVEKERQNQTPTQSGDKEVQLMDRILKNIGDIETQRSVKKIKISSSLKGHAVEDQFVKIQGQYNERWGKQTKKLFNDPDSRRKILNVIERMRAGETEVLQKVLNVI